MFWGVLLLYRCGSFFRVASVLIQCCHSSPLPWWGAYVPSYVTPWWLEPSGTLFFTVSTLHVFYFPLFFIKSRFILHESLSVDGPLISNALNITCVVGRSTFNLTREHLLQLRDFHMFLYGAENYPRQTRLNLYCFVQVC